MTHSLTLTRRRLGVLALAVLTAAGCASRPDVRHDQPADADLAAYRSFAFAEIGGDDASPYSALLASRLKLATRGQMERRGYAFDGARPDLLVGLRLVVRDKQEIRSQSGVYGRAHWRAVPVDVHSVDYRHGTLVVDLVDLRRGALVWHGVAEGRLDAQALEQPAVAIDAAVAEIFARFPVGGRG